MNKEIDTQELLSEITIYSKYAKYLRKGKRRESWKEIIDRNKKMHIDKFPDLKDEINEAYKLVHDKKILPSMRALEDSTPIRTISGWKNAGEIEKNDIIFDSKGEKTKVIDVVKFKDKELFKLVFSDNSEIISCDEHLWIVKTEDDKAYKKNSRVVDTNFIRNHLKVGNRYNISIYNPLPIQLEEKSFKIDPYILGHWLGDGYSSGYQFSTSVEDSEFFSEQYRKAGYPNRQSKSSNIWTWSVRGLVKDLREYNLLFNKHIPTDYQNGSMEQRLNLLQGLIDSDGCIDKNGRCLFSNANLNLINDVKELLSSLGIKYTIYLFKKEKSHHKDIINIMFTTILPVARLPRKLERIRKKELVQTEHRKVIQVVPIGKGNATCFHVDSKDHSFLAGKQMIVTHNSLQFAGKPIELNPTRIFNCSYTPIDHYKTFSEIMFLLLGGVGVGYSVQKHHIEKLPSIRKPLKSKRFLVGDSIEGWSNAVNYLIKAYLSNGPKPLFDFRDIREKGAELKTAGGKAPGAGPLKICLAHIEAILDNKKDGEQLRPIECHDIVCHISDAVLAGGIRRAACISLFSFDDEEMLHSKHGNWWELNPQRARANNSIVLVRSKIKKEDFDYVWKNIKDSNAGEPGLFFTNDKDMGANPCLEISLKNNSFCNLVEVNVSNVISQEDFNNRVKKASFIATLQASYTDFHFLRPIWKKNAEDESLIGVSMTGISDGEVLQYNIKEAAEEVKKENERVSELIKINKARRCTCIKPSGTASILLKTSSGIHARYAPYYWRRVRVGKSESLYTYLTINAPELLEDDEMNSSLAIIKVCIKSPLHSIYRNENVISFLERIKLIHDEWIKGGHRKGVNCNNVSATISIKDNEWEEVGNWAWNNRESYTGLSFLPYDNSSYVQMPFEECTEKDYLDFCEAIKDIKIDLTQVVEFSDNTDLQGEVACGGGSSCEVK